MIRYQQIIEIIILLLILSDFLFVLLIVKTYIYFFCSFSICAYKLVFTCIAHETFSHSSMWWSGTNLSIIELIEYFIVELEWTEGVV